MKLRKLLLKLAPLGLFFGYALLDERAVAGLYEDRSNYRQAKYALALGRSSDFRRLRGMLDEYVLSTYLDYHAELGRLNQIKPAEALAIRERFKDYSLGDRFFSQWLLRQARSKRWQTYAQYYEPSLSVEAQCYYLQALIHTGAVESAFQLVPKVWVFEKSQPKVCDMPFNRWIRANRVTHDLAWTRMEMALRAKQTVLANYLLRFFSRDVRKSADALIRTNRRPSLTNNRHNFVNDRWGRAALRFGLFKLAQSDAEQADANWQKNRNAFDFSQYERQEIEDELGFWLARNDVVPTTGSDLSVYSTRTLGSILDTVLSQQDWQYASTLLESLPETERMTDKWRYWAGIVAIRMSDKAVPTEDFKQLATERHYYGFLAASHLKLASQLNNVKPDNQTNLSTSVLSNPRINLILELFAVGDSANARLEWKFVQTSLSDEEKLVVVQQFAELGLTYDAIYTANDAGAQDVLAVRFPMPYLHEFRRQSHETNIPIEYLLGITRQESAFQPSAVSRVGARGLMQLMPGTANATAARIRISKPSASSLLLPHINIRIGAHHVAELMTAFDGNRILAAAAYNAGSHNVRRWLPKETSMNSISWIERIPFYETRSYVKSVLAFSHVYALLMDHDRPVIEAHEWTIPVASSF